LHSILTDFGKVTQLKATKQQRVEVDRSDISFVEVEAR